MNVLINVKRVNDSLKRDELYFIFHVSELIFLESFDHYLEHSSDLKVLTYILTRHFS